MDHRAKHKDTKHKASRRKHENITTFEKVMVS